MVWDTLAESRLRRLFLLFVTLSVWVGDPAAVLGAGAEHLVKAAITFKFPSYVQWPDTALPAGNGPLVFAVTGDREVYEAFRTTIDGKTVGDRTCTVTWVPSPVPVPACHVIFFTQGTPEPDASWWHQAAERSIVTVGEKPGFGKRGAIFNFFIEDGRVRFEINPAAARRANLKVNPRLLQLAPLVGD